MDEQEKLICENCGDQIRENEMYFRYTDGKTDLILCECCMEDCKHWT